MIILSTFTITNPIATKIEPNMYTTGNFVCLISISDIIATGIVSESPTVAATAKVSFPYSFRHLEILRALLEATNSHSERFQISYLAASIIKPFL